MRGTTRILLPISLVFAFILGSQGVIANFHGFHAVTTVEGVKQLIPGGPVAGWMAIKQLGSNGGGFFNVNSAHPFENPTQLSNFLELYLTVLLAFALAVAFGVLVKDKRQGRMVLGIMVVVWIAGSSVRQLRRDQRQPAAHRGRREPVDQRRPGRRQHGRQGGAQRRLVLGGVGRVGHADVERLRQLDARQLDAVGLARAVLRHVSPARSRRAASASA